MPDDIITGKCDEKDVAQVQKCPDPPRFQAPPENVDAALNMLERAERPLILVGKGMAWAHAEDEVRAFIERTQVPFLRSPMGKGVMPDEHPLGSRRPAPWHCRTPTWFFGWAPGSTGSCPPAFAGARPGLPPRYAKDVKVIQL